MIELRRLTPEQWYAFSEGAHQAVFGKQRDPWLDRISYALLASDGLDPVGFVTVRETDAESVYWQYGGALHQHRGPKAVRAFQEILGFTASRYRRCTTYVKNDNVGYLHLLMKMGFRAIGCRFTYGDIYLEMFREFDHALQEQKPDALHVPEAPEDRKAVGDGNRERIGASRKEKTQDLGHHG